MYMTKIIIFYIFGLQAKLTGQIAKRELNDVSLNFLDWVTFLCFLNIFSQIL